MLTFPQNLRGLGWPVPKIPEWDGVAQKSSSGKLLLLGYYSFPVWHWNLTFNYLKDIPGDTFGAYNPVTDLQQLVGFYNQNGGPFGGVFWFNDITDNTVPSGSPQLIGIGDGSTRTFQLLRTYGGFTEPVQAPQTQVLYDNGTPISSGAYSVSATGLVTFATAPLATHAITWSGTYFWNVHFEEGIDPERFLWQVWRNKTCKLEMVKQ